MSYMFNLFKYLTSITYLLLIISWCFIFVFYLKRIKSQSFQDKLLRTLLIILSFDSLRTLFESFFFGIRQASLVGIIDEIVYDLLSKPHIVFIPKVVNLLVSVVIIFILIRKIIPQENDRIIKFKQMIHDKDIVIDQIPTSVLITDLV